MLSRLARGVTLKQLPLPTVAFSSDFVATVRLASPFVVLFGTPLILPLPLFPAALWPTLGDNPHNTHKKAAVLRAFSLSSTFALVAQDNALRA